MPRELVTAARYLFDELGMYDPRGLDLHHATIRVAGLRGDHRSLTTTAWLIPGVFEGRQFVLGRNGLLYAAEHVGDIADVTDEFEFEHALVYFHDEATNHTNQLGLFWILQLFRVGEIDAARNAWTRRLEQFERTAGNRELNEHEMAREWMWMHLHRAVNAHIRGDDPLALHDVRVATRITAEADLHLYHRNAETLVLLLDDQERRATPSPPATQDLARLIDTLDQITGDPELDFADVPVVQELIAMGFEAVEPLLNVVETDRRLTRVVRYNGDPPSRERWVVPVAEPAYFAVGRILHSNTHLSFGYFDEERTSRLAASARSHWRRFGRMSQWERWFTVLADDDESVEFWVEAAKQLTTPDDALTTTEGFESPDSWTPAATPLGEPLREDGRLTRLLVHRLEQIVVADRREQVAHRFCGMAAALFRWDADAARAALRPRLRSCERGRCSCTPQLFHGLWDDTRGPRRYIRWLRRALARHQHEGEFLMNGLFPFLHRPTNPFLVREVERMLRRQSLSQLVEAQGWRLDPDLLSLPAVRAIIATLLQSEDVIGTVRIRNGRVSWHPDGSAWDGYPQTTAGETADGVESVRRRDQVATQLMNYFHRGEPPVEFRVYWSRGRRDEALAQLELWLSSH